MIDFGAFPGSSDANAAVTGQTAIVSGSIVGASLRLEATADHSADEHFIESISVFAGNIVAGTGFTVYARNTGFLSEPLESPGSQRRQVAHTTAGNNTKGPGDQGKSVGGLGTRIYGQWNVAWAWV